MVGAIGANVVEHKVEGHKKKHRKHDSDGNLRPERHGHHHHGRHSRHGSRSRSRGIDGSSSGSDSD